MKTLAATVAVATTLLVHPSATTAGQPRDVVFYWTVQRARAELAQNGIAARCRGRYDRFRAQGAWYYRYFRCSGRAAGRFDLIVRGADRYELIPTVDPDPAPKASRLGPDSA